MKNQFGLICPIPWESIPSDFNWIAQNADGRFYMYQQRPFTPVSGEWLSSSFDEFYVLYILSPPPKDVTKCLWERPKN